jgi:bifunctional non-homologous end joining protein LigD
MLSTPIEEAFDGPQWFFEIKWDGYRAIAFIENGKARLVSRNQNDLTSKRRRRFSTAKSWRLMIKAGLRSV